MDKTRLRQELLWRCGFVVGLGSGWEVLVDEDPFAVVMAAARMDRQALELQEDLDVVLGQLD